MTDTEQKIMPSTNSKLIISDQQFRQIFEKVYDETLYNTSQKIVNNWFEILFCNHQICFKNPTTHKLNVMEIANESCEISTFCNVDRPFWQTIPKDFTCEIIFKSYDILYDKIKDESMTEEEIVLLEQKMENGKVLWNKSNMSKRDILVMLGPLHMVGFTTTDTA